MRVAGSQYISDTPDKCSRRFNTTVGLRRLYAFAIPIPVETANINAVVKPFQWRRIKIGLY
jgi:hypothetical protein